jgi:hypothetical protein
MFAKLLLAIPFLLVNRQFWNAVECQIRSRFSSNNALGKVDRHYAWPDPPQEQQKSEPYQSRTNFTPIELCHPLEKNIPLFHEVEFATQVLGMRYYEYWNHTPEEIRTLNIMAYNIYNAKQRSIRQPPKYVPCPPARVIQV